MSYAAWKRLTPVIYRKIDFLNGSIVSKDLRQMCLGDIPGESMDVQFRPSSALFGHPIEEDRGSRFRDGHLL